MPPLPSPLPRGEREQNPSYPLCVTAVSAVLHPYHITQNTGSAPDPPVHSPHAPTRSFSLHPLRRLQRACPAQPNSYNFDFVTITNPGNPAFNKAPTGDSFYGRGVVDYEYRIATTEISTAQWMEFANSLAQRGPIWALGIDVDRWGARLNSSTFTFEMIPELKRASGVHVGGMTFSQAAVYCNWLQNGKRNDDASHLTRRARSASEGSAHQNKPSLALRARQDALSKSRNLRSAA